MSSFLTDPFSINGVISTDKSVISNINDLATAAGAWVTYDISQGKYAVVINTTGSSIASFDDSNIIGGINVSGTGINELYNKVSIEFPHKDLNDERDYIDLEIATADRLPNELDNKLSIYTDLINDPVQAQFIASVELKQTRLDKIIEFRTDYSKIGLKAGDLIDVTNDTYNYTNKVFRIVKIQEDDGDVLAISITALEYDADVYDDTGLERRFRDRRTGIIPVNINEAVVASDVKAVALDNADGSANYFTTSEIENIITLGSGSLYEFLKASSNVTTAGFKEENPGTSIPSFSAGELLFSDSTVASTFQAYAGNVTPSGQEQGSGFNGNTSSFLQGNIAIPDCEILNIQVEVPFLEMTAFIRNYYFFRSSFYLDADYAPSVTPTGIYFKGWPNDNFSQWIEQREIPIFGPTNFAYDSAVIQAYMPMQIRMYYEGSLVVTKSSNWYTPTVGFQYNTAIPAGTLTFEFIPLPMTTPAILDTRYIYHGGHTSAGSGLSLLYVSVQTFKQT